MTFSLAKTLPPARNKRSSTLWLLFLVFHFTYGFSKNCSKTNVSLVSCGPHNSTRDQCLGRDCCWNSSSDANTTQCYGVANNESTSNSTKTTSVPMTTIEATSVKKQTESHKGSCQVYKGEVCDEWLNFTLPEHRWSPRFVDNKYGMNKTEGVIKIFLTAVDRIDKGQERCQAIFRIVLCQYMFPLCNDESGPYPSCREDCEALFQECHFAMTEMMGVAKFIFEERGLNFTHVEVPRCTNHRYLHEYKAENKTCLHWGVFDFTSSKPPPQERSNVFLIATVAAGVSSFLFIIAIILCACIRCRRNKPPSLATNAVVFAAMSMRDRIRAESMQALDDKGLGHLNPEVIKQFPLRSVEYIRDLGSGNFGMVFLGRAYGLVPGKEDAELMVAVKSLKEGSSIETKEDFFKEVAMMSLLHHENIVELLAVSTEEEPYGMIFEFMEFGDLNQYLRKAGPFFHGDEKEKVTLRQDDLLSIALQCAAGMEHLQALRFVHRDVAARNCLVGTGMIVKISDFGMSRDIYVSDYYKVEGRALLPVRWMPPEALLLGKFTVESDVYSFGVLLWEIYTLGLQPYYGYNNEDVVEFILKGVHLGQPEDCPDHVYHVMKNCWEKEATERPIFTVIKAGLKQEVMPQHEAEVLVKQPLYQNTGGSTEGLKNFEGHPSTSKMLYQNTAHAVKSDKNSNPVYVNCNQGYVKEDVDVAVAKELSQQAPDASKATNMDNNCNQGYFNAGVEFELGIEVA